MTARHIAITVALTLGAQSLWADNARQRGGGQPGGRGHGGNGQSAYRPRPAGSASVSGGPRTPAGAPRPLTYAQQRQPRPGTGAYYRGYPYYPYSRPYGYGYRYGYYPYYPYYAPYSAFYFGLGLGWANPYGSAYFGVGPYNGGGYYGGGAYYGYPYAYSPNGGSGAIRVLVAPPKTRVYVDGYYAGIVNDFDGVFQRLYVAPGGHEIALKLDGYLTHRVKVYLAPGATLKLHHDMVVGVGPDTLEDLAGSAERYDPGAGQANPEATLAPPQNERGQLRFAIKPPDASIYLDGRFWGTGRGEPELELPPGRHHVEIVRPWFLTAERDVEIQPGRTERLELVLTQP